MAKRHTKVFPAYCLLCLSGRRVDDCEGALTFLYRKGVYYNGAGKAALDGGERFVPGAMQVSTLLPLFASVLLLAYTAYAAVAVWHFEPDRSIHCRRAGGGSKISVLAALYCSAPYTPHSCQRVSFGL